MQSDNAAPVLRFRFPYSYCGGCAHPGKVVHNGHGPNCPRWPFKEKK